MASVDWMKIHAPSELKRILRHCDMYQRERDGHRNPDINKDLTYLNYQMPRRTYHTVCKMYDKKIKQLDSLPGANKRKDRVTCFGLEIPAPKDIRKSMMADWFKDVFSIFCQEFDIANILQYYVHYDEVHSYLSAETGKFERSRVHAHCFIIPEHDGKLNGKWFSSRKHMVELNNKIHNLSILHYGVEFMDGTKQGSVKKVEQLKRESDIKYFKKVIADNEKRLKDLMDAGEITSKLSGMDGFSDDTVAEIWALGLAEYNKLKDSDLYKMIDDAKTEDSDKNDDSMVDGIFVESVDDEDDVKVNFNGVFIESDDDNDK